MRNSLYVEQGNNSNWDSCSKVIVSDPKGSRAISLSEQVTFNSENSVSKSTVYSAPPGYILLNYYWVKFKWTDESGAHEVESDKAFCSTGYK